MKKLTSMILTFLLIALIPLFAGADEITKTFAWDPPSDIDKILNWEMHWGSTKGGPYAKLVDIPKDGTFEEPITVDISGPPATEQTRYFVLKACGNVQTGPDGTTEFQCSENSNEVSFSVWVPDTAMQVPINFRIIPE